MKTTVLGVISQHVNKFNLIRGCQHGFRRGWSCVINLLAFLNKVMACKCNDAKECVPLSQCVRLTLMNEYEWLLFLILINDLDLGILNTILKFADDTKIFCNVLTTNNRLQVQADLDKLCTWANNWQMNFNVCKCKVMHIGPRNANYSYCMNR